MQTLAGFGRLTSPPELRSDVGGSKQRESSRIAMLRIISVKIDETARRRRFFLTIL